MSSSTVCELSKSTVADTALALLIAAVTLRLSGSYGSTLAARRIPPSHFSSSPPTLPTLAHSLSEWSESSGSEAITAAPPWASPPLTPVSSLYVSVPSPSSSSTSFCVALALRLAFLAEKSTAALSVAPSSTAGALYLASSVGITLPPWMAHLAVTSISSASKTLALSDSLLFEVSNAASAPVLLSFRLKDGAPTPDACDPLWIENTSAGIVTVSAWPPRSAIFAIALNLPLTASYVSLTDLSVRNDSSIEVVLTGAALGLNAGLGAAGTAALGLEAAGAAAAAATAAARLAASAAALALASASALTLASALALALASSSLMRIGSVTNDLNA
mmetsp:Transcript_10202/g.31921  ORF Transcript_10202/g.31921 Transcript_10202/m.31921 type:complete len:333 (+) Transcript_10202:285-1283(+)